jgi:hypothetical protein
VTADELYRSVFTETEPDAGSIRAAFFVDGASGKVTHTAGFVGRDVLLNAQDGGARVWSLKGLSVWFWKRVA